MHESDYAGRTHDNIARRIVLTQLKGISEMAHYLASFINRQATVRVQTRVILMLIAVSAIFSNC